MYRLPTICLRAFLPLTVSRCLILNTVYFAGKIVPLVKSDLASFSAMLGKNGLKMD